MESAGASLPCDSSTIKRNNKNIVVNEVHVSTTLVTPQADTEAGWLQTWLVVLREACGQGFAEHYLPSDLGAKESS